MTNEFLILKDGEVMASSSRFLDALVWATVYADKFPDSKISLLVSARDS